MYKTFLTEAKLKMPTKEIKAIIAKTFGGMETKVKIGFTSDKQGAKIHVFGDTSNPRFIVAAQDADKLIKTEIGRGLRKESDVVGYKDYGTYISFPVMYLHQKWKV